MGAAALAADDSDDDEEAAAAHPTETSQEKALRIIKYAILCPRRAGLDSNRNTTHPQRNQGQLPVCYRAHLPAAEGRPVPGGVLRSRGHRHVGRPVVQSVGRHPSSAPPSEQLAGVAPLLGLHWTGCHLIAYPCRVRRVCVVCRVVWRAQRLKMQSNVLEKFSLLRGAFASLQELDLSGNNLTSLPIEIVLSLSLSVCVCVCRTHTHTPTTLNPHRGEAKDAA